MSEPETALRTLWTSQGVPIERQDEMIADIAHKAQPASIAEWWEALRRPPTEPTPEGLQYVIPGCEKDHSRGPKQGELF